MVARRPRRVPLAVRNRPEPFSIRSVPANFDARAYLLATNRWFKRWPRRFLRELEQRGFRRIFFDQVSPHPVWHVRVELPAGSLTIRQAGQTLRRTAEREGTIPPGGFFSFSPRKGVVEAAFVLIV